MSTNMANKSMFRVVLMLIIRFILISSAPSCENASSWKQDSRNDYIKSNFKFFLEKRFDDCVLLNGNNNRNFKSRKNIADNILINYMDRGINSRLTRTDFLLVAQSNLKLANCRIIALVIARAQQKISDIFCFLIVIINFFHAAFKFISLPLFF